MWRNALNCTTATFVTSCCLVLPKIKPGILLESHRVCLLFPTKMDRFQASLFALRCSMKHIPTARPPGINALRPNWNELQKHLWICKCKLVLNSKHGQIFIGCLNLWGGPMLARPDWYPWRCEGGNINTAVRESSLRSGLGWCSQGWGSSRHLQSHKEAERIKDFRSFGLLEGAAEYWGLVCPGLWWVWGPSQCWKTRVRRFTGRAQRSWWLRRV